jgi:dipeptidyl aminopeptidase/acylaminoacyl peptidase
MPTGAFGIKWFPDSRRLAFLSWTWPDTRLAGLEKRYKAHKERKVQAHVVEHAAYRYWDHWLSDGRVLHLFSVDVDSGRVRDLLEGTKYELVMADPSANLYDISPEGREVAFSHDPAAEKRFDHAHEIVAVDVRTRRGRVLTKGSPLSHFAPRYSPDGKRLALLVQDLRRSHIDPHRLAFIDRTNGRLSVVKSTWDRSIHEPFEWAPDSGAVLFVAEDDARQHLHRWPVDASKPAIVARGGTVADFCVAGDAVVFLRHALDRPTQAFWTNGDGERRIESFNDERVAGWRLGEARDVRFPGYDGDEVQMWVVYPPDFDPKRKWPLMQVVHGGPHSMWGDAFHPRWNLHAMAAEGYIVAGVNYHGSSSFGRKFTESIEREFGKREYFDVEAATDMLVREGSVDRDRLVAGGGSYGGYMVAWMNGHTDRYKAYVCHAGCFDWVAMVADDAWYWFPKELGAAYWDDADRVDAQNPRAFVKRMKTPTLVTHGLLDYRVPDAQGLAYYNTLKYKGVPTRLVFFPDENHWILKPQNARLWYREYFAWMARFAKPGPARKGAAKKRRR